MFREQSGKTSGFPVEGGISREALGRPHIRSKKPLIRTLEPRMVFDAAAVVAVEHAAQAPAHHEPIGDAGHSPVVEPSCGHLAEALKAAPVTALAKPPAMDVPAPVMPAHVDAPVEGSKGVDAPVKIQEMDGTDLSVGQALSPASPRIGPANAEPIEQTNQPPAIEVANDRPMETARPNTSAVTATDHNVSVAPDRAATDPRGDDATSGNHAVTPDAADASTKEVVFIWDNVKDWQQIAANLGDRRIYVLDSAKDGIAQIAAILKGESDIGAIHLISHGAEGSLNLGTAVLDADTMQGQYRDELTGIGHTLSKDGDILIYGCDFAAGNDGLQPAAVLGHITQADIAASIDPTGAAALGGDWDLEQRTGTIETAAITDYAYAALLAAPTIDLDGALGATGDFAASYTENAPPVSIVADGPAGATITDSDGDLQSITITADAAPNGNAEHLSFGGLAVALGSDSTNTVVVGATTYSIVYSAATRTFTITNNGGGTIPSGGDTNTLVRSITYDNGSDNPTNRGANTGRVFSFTATDATSVTSATSTATVTIAAVNDGPVGVADSNAIAEDGVATGNVIANDTDADGDTLSVTQFEIDGTTYTAGQTANVSGVGTLVIGADGAYTFTPAANYDGPVPVATYTLSDGGLAATATLTLSITAVNDPPVDGDETNTVAEDTVMTIGDGAAGDLLDNATDIDGGALTVAGFSVAGHTGPFVIGSVYTIAGIGDITINANGSYSFAPAANYVGAIPVITYTVSDGAGGTDSSTLTLTIVPANDAPEGTDDTATIAEDTAFSFTAASFGFTDPNDTPADAMQAVIITTLPPAAEGTLLLGGVAVTAGQTIALADIPSLTFQPAADVNGIGIGSFTFQVVDNGGTANGGGDTDQSPNTFAFNITAVNDAPVAADDTVTTPEDTALNVPAGSGVLANDTDVDGDTLTITQFTVSGITASAGQSGNIPGVGRLTVNADGSYSFIPVANFAGPVPVITYTVSDGQGGTDTATLTINVIPVNDLPVDGDETNSVTEDTVLTVADGSAGDLLANSGDLDGDPLTISGFTVAGETGPFVVGTGYLIAGVGTVIINANGSYSFAPVANYDGPIPVVTYTVSDGAGGTDTSTLALTMTPVNDPPVAQDDAATTPENTPVSGNVLSNDTDIDDPTLTVTFFEIGGQTYGAGATAAIAGVGTLVINTDGSYVFAPAPSYNGPVPDVTYTVSDGEATDTAVLRLNVTPLNDPPVADDETGTTPEDTTLTVPAGSGLLVGDSDVDGDTLVITTFEVGGTTYTAGDTATIAGVGALTIDADGSYQFVPDANYNGAVPVATYTVSDGNGGTDQGTLTLTVTPVNDPPVAVDDSNTTPEDTPLSGSVLANDTDVDGDQLTIVGFEVAGIPGAFIAGSTATIPGVGTVTINPDGTYTLVPAANYTGPVPDVTYILSDGNGGTVTGTLTLDVTPVNDPPGAIDDSGTTTQDTDLNGNVLGNDTDVDGDALTITGFSIGGTTYAPGDTATIPGVGALTLRLDGSYTFVPEPGYTGPVPDVTYTVSDGTASDDGTLTIDVIPPNAVGANSDAATTPEDTTLTGNVLANDVDPNGDSLSVVNFTVAGDPTVYAVGSPATIAGIGTLTINIDGSYTFVPALNYFGPVPVATYTATDGTLSDTATLTITVTPVNDLPVAVNDSGTMPEDTALTGNVLTNDTDVDGNTLSITGFVVAGVNLASGQTAIIPTVGRLTINANGSYSFVPVADYDGPVPIATYTVSDGNGGTATATLTIGITPVNDSPVAVDDTGSTPEDTTLSVSAPGLLSNDTDVDGDALAISSFAVAGVPGSFTAGSAATIAGIGVLTINADGSYTFVPAADFTGPVPVVTYAMTDGTLTDTATLSLTVTPVNDPPVASDDTATVAEDTTLTVPAASGLFVNDTDIDGGALSVTQFEVAGIIFGPGTIATIPGVGNLTINADGSYVFTPVANYNGPVPPATYTVSDGNGGTDTAVLRITVTPVNDAPVAADNSGTTPEDTVLTGEVLSNDSDIDGDTLSVAQFTVAGDPTVHAAGTTATITGIGDLTINADGSYTFVPAANYNGPVPIATYTASDGNGGTDTATLTLNVTPVNDAPIPVDDTGTTPEDTTLTVSAASGLLSNDTDAEGDALTIQGFSVAGISGGFLAGATATIPGIGTLTINANGSYTFVPVANYNGPGPVATYRVTDGVLTAEAVLSITVTPVNDPPIDGNETNAVTEDTTLTVPAASGLLVNTTDIDGGAPLVVDFTVAGEAGPFAVGSGYLIAGVGTITINADGSYSFAPVADYTGAIPGVTYTVSDGAGGTDTSTLTLTMVPINDPPVAADDTGTTPEDTTLNGNVLTNDTDIDGGSLSVTQFTIAGDATVHAAGTAATIVGVGALTINADGNYTFVPAANYNGPVPVATYTVSDGALTDTGTLTLDVTPINDPPVDGNETNSVTEDTTLTIPAAGGLLANTTDIDGGTPSVSGFTVAGQSGPFAIGSGYLIARVGTITINADGSYAFTPVADYTGAIPVITYTVSDGAGGTDSSTLTLTMVPVNDPPVDGDETNAVTEDTTLTVPAASGLLANTTDIDGGAPVVIGFTVAGQSGPFAIGSGYLISGVGTIIVNADGSYAFTPVANYTGAIPVITYTLSDGAGGIDTSTLTLTMVPVNDPPVASDDTATTPEDTTLNGNVLTNDTDIDGGPLSVTQFSVNGTTYTPGQTAAINGIGALTINADGSYTFVPALNYNGPAPASTYTVSDGRGGVDTAALGITVTPVNDAPDPDDGDGIDTDGNGDGDGDGRDIPDQTSVDATTVSTVSVSGYFFDVDGDVLTYSVTGLPAGLSIDPSTGLISGTLPNNASHTSPYIVVVTATDPSGLSTTQTFTWTVTNPAPIANDDAATVAEDTVLTGGVLANDSDPDGDTFIVTQFAFGGRTYLAGRTATLAGVGSLVINTDGSYTFTPALNFNGSVPAATYTLRDSDGGTDTATLSITVTPVNDAPIIIDDQASGNEDTTITGNVLGNDSDPDNDPLTVTSFSVDGDPANYLPGDTASIPGVGSITMGSNGDFVFVPEPNYDGPVPDVVYSASDGHGGTGQATLVITITPIDDFVPTPAPNQPELPAGPDYGIQPLEANGAVLDAVDELGALDRITDIAGRPADAPMRLPPITTFLGGSSTILIETPGGDERIRLETVKHTGVIYLEILEEPKNGGESSVLAYRLRATDGSAAPAWLRQIGPLSFVGNPDTQSGMINLVLSIVQRDGRVSEHLLRLDTASGNVSQPPEPQRHGFDERPAPMFSEQMNERSRSNAALERALGFR
ncbi:Ig-like domain-containing protein [Rhizobium sp. SIMBA_035]